mgnify:FL=1
MELAAIQKALRQEGLDGWLLCDFRNRDALAYRVLGLDFAKVTTRRWYYYIPARGSPKKIVSVVERARLDGLPGSTRLYLSWRELHRALRAALGEKRRIALQYSPKNNVPYVSIVDAGTVELLRSFGHKIVSSADLVQRFVSLIGEEGYRSHKRAAEIVDAIRKEAFEEIRRAVQDGTGATELDVQRFILRRFEERGLTTDSPPMVGTNEHPADPHFDLTPENSRPFRRGDTVLIDLWAKRKEPGSIYYDSTWVGYVGEDPPREYVEIFEAVREARDAAVAFVRDRFRKGAPPRGWEVDDVARGVVERAGYGKRFLHRTGHSIGEETHGTGVNIDNLETRDERALMPGCCFSIEPGIYLEGRMAARTEIDVFIRPDGAVEVTGELQREIVRL